MGLKNKDMTTIVIEQMIHGKEVLNQIEAYREYQNDLMNDVNQIKDTIYKIHQPELELKVVEITDLNKETKLIRLISNTKESLPVFEAGKFINLYFEIDNITTSRPYSLCSSPNNTSYYEIAVNLKKNGFVTNYIFNSLKVGDVLKAKGPLGTFFFNPVFHKKKSVFIAGGSGITPFRSMIYDALEKNENRDLYLIYGVRDLSVALFNDEFNQLTKNFPNFHYVVVVSNDDKCKERRGFVTKELIEEVVGEIDNATFYLCGPGIMTGLVEGYLKELKVKPQHIRNEKFASIEDITNAPGYPKGILKDTFFNIKIGNKMIKANSSETVLTALERNGFKVNVGCRIGECSYCRIKLVSGKVYTLSGALMRYADGSFGYIHSCRAYPISDLEIIL